MVQEEVRKQELMKAATKKEMMPNMIAVITTNSNDSSPNNTRILDNSKLEGSVDRPRTSEEFSDTVSRAASTSASVENRSRDRIDNSEESTPNESPDPSSKFDVGENPEIPNTPPRHDTRPPVVPPELSSNELLNYHNSDKFSGSFPEGKETSAVEGGVARDFPFRKMIVGALRRRRRLAGRASANGSWSDESNCETKAKIRAIRTY